MFTIYYNNKIYNYFIWNCHAFNKWIYKFYYRKKNWLKITKRNNKDGGLYFKSKIIGGIGKFDKIKLNHVNALLNNNSCEKSLKYFRNELNNEKMSYSELCELIKRINNSLGFLGNFLEKFPIDFTYFKNINIPDIYASARKSDEIFIEFGEEVISSC